MSYETLSRRLWSPSRDQNLAACPPKILEARDTLTQFASKQLGLSFGPRRWDTRVEMMDLSAPNGWRPAALLAVLDFVQTPQVILGIELETPRHTAWIMRERAGIAEPGRAQVWKAAQAIILPADMKHLNAVLEKLLAAGVIVKTPDGLRFTGKRPAFKSV